MLGRKAAPISTLKYIYSSDGMIAGRMIDGKFQMYLKTYPPKGRYNKDTGVLTVYE